MLFSLKARDGVNGLFGLLFFKKRGLVSLTKPRIKPQQPSQITGK